MAFPWDTLITAASTLIAGFGGISLKDRRDTARVREQVRLDANLEMMLRLDQLERVFSSAETLDPHVLAATVGKSAAQAIGSVQRAYFKVFLVASRRVQPTAGKAWRAAWDIHSGWLDSDGRSDIGKLKELLASLRTASTAFADAVQREEAGRRFGTRKLGALRPRTPNP